MLQIWRKRVPWSATQSIRENDRISEWVLEYQFYRPRGNWRRQVRCWQIYCRLVPLMEGSHISICFLEGSIRGLFCFWSPCSESRAGTNALRLLWLQPPLGTDLSKSAGISAPYLTYSTLSRLRPRKHRSLGVYILYMLRGEECPAISKSETLLANHLWYRECLIVHPATTDLISPMPRNALPLFPPSTPKHIRVSVERGARVWIIYDESQNSQVYVARADLPLMIGSQKLKWCSKWEESTEVLLNPF